MWNLKGCGRAKWVQPAPVAEHQTCSEKITRHTEVTPKRQNGSYFRIHHSPGTHENLRQTSVMGRVIAGQVR